VIPVEHGHVDLGGQPLCDAVAGRRRADADGVDNDRDAGLVRRAAGGHHRGLSRFTYGPHVQQARLRRGDHVADLALVVGHHREPAPV